MPVIRGTLPTTVLTTDQRSALLEQLKNERAGRSAENGPILFEIPLERTTKMDVLVVWQRFHGLRSEDRSELILETYDDERERISQALGVTYQEAIEQQVLPYSVVPMSRSNEVVPQVLRHAMLEEGGIALSESRVDLRFPTMAMAESAHRRLCDRVPKGYWSIVQEVAQIPFSYHAAP